jgi:hypothetical protein
MILLRLMTSAGEHARMMKQKPTLAALLLVTGFPVAAADDPLAQQQHNRVTYADDVAPILQKHCAECHLPGMEGARKTGFLVDSYESVMGETFYGPVIKPGLASTSSLYILISAKDKLMVSMPHGKASLDAGEIETVRAWIDAGAPEN